MIDWFPMGLLPSLTGLAVFLVYVFLAGPSFYWLDSSEFVAATWSLGVAHPPGHPLAALLARLVCYLPVGTLAFRVTLASALQAAFATALVAMIGQQLLMRTNKVQDDLRKPRAPDWFQQLAVAVSALVAGLSYSVCFQAVRAEVYALNLLLLLLATYFLLVWDWTRDRRKLLAAALVGGFALCNHHFLALLAVPPAILFVLARRPDKGPKLKLIVGVLLSGMLGLSTLAYLPLRAKQTPQVNWGSPSTLDRFAWVVSASAFQKAVKQSARQTIEHRAGGAFFAVLGGLGPAAALFSFAGLYLLWRGRGCRKTAALLTGLVGFNLVGPFLVGFDPMNPDAHGYLAVAVALLSPAIAVFLVAAVRALADRARQTIFVVGALALALVLFQAIVHLPRCNLRNHWAAEETARHILNQPSGTLLITSYFETIFNVWALQTTADLRPDVRVLHRNFLSQPGYVDDLRVTWPEIYPLAQNWRQHNRLLLKDLDQFLTKRPIAVEYDLNIPHGLAQKLRPAGLTLTYGGTPQPTDWLLHRQRIGQWTYELGPVVEHETRRAMTWTHYLLAHFACRRNLTKMARMHIHKALLLAPEAQALKQLAQNCRKTLGQ
ncbi:MAG: DUF2723 domain-containing protein [Pseudomonadota bacterium]